MPVFPHVDVLGMGHGVLRRPEKEVVPHLVRGEAALELAQSYHLSPVRARGWIDPAHHIAPATLQIAVEHLLGGVKSELVAVEPVDQVSAVTTCTS